MIEKLTRNGLTYLNIQTPKVQALLTTHGAHILSFKPAEASSDLLWVSQESKFAPEQPIRGGIPVCWPYFGAAENPSMPQHGMARLIDWEIISVNESSYGVATIKLKLDSAKLPEIYQNLTLDAEFELGTVLQIKLNMSNQGKQPQKISCALHTYFAVKDVRDVRILGLDNVEYYSKAEDCMGKQLGDITFEKEVDRIYLDTSSDCVIQDPGLKRNIRIAKQNSKTTVVWNPWIAKSQSMSDFGNEEYLEMVCVETVNTRDDSRTLAPGETHSIIAIISQD